MEVNSMRLAVLIAAVTALGAGSAFAAPATKQPQLSVDDVTVTEGNAGTTNATFTVTLSAAANKPVTVDYRTADGTASAGSDYTPASGTLVFARGETAKQITVRVNGDTAPEVSESFFLVLSNAAEAVIGRGTGQATIGNDDVASRTLTVTRNGTGTGLVGSSPDGISCGDDCSESYPDGSSVELTATAAPGSTFAGWSGACSGTGTCSVVMDGDRTATATFTATPVETYTLTVSCTDETLIFGALPCDQAGSADRVASSPGSISCGNGGFCEESFDAGTAVTLTATSGLGSPFAFIGWDGDCAGQGNPCSVTMNGPRTVGATFG